MRKEINAFRREYNAIHVIYKKLQEDRDRADISYIIMKLHRVVEENILPEEVAEAGERIFDISNINFDLLKQEFKKYPAKNTLVQELKAAIDKKLERLIQRNPLRVDFQEKYANIIAEYNIEKDRQTIEQTFEELYRFVRDLDNEEKRAVREGLDEENLALFDLLCKPGLSNKSINILKKVAKDLLSPVTSPG